MGAQMGFPSGPGAANLRFARPPGGLGVGAPPEMVMGPQGPMMSGPRGLLPMDGNGAPRGPAPPFGAMMQPGGGAAGSGGEFGPGAEVPTSQEFPMPPNFPGAIEMMNQVRWFGNRNLIR